MNSTLGKYSGYAYAIMRIVVGLMLACHGLQLVFGMFGGMPGSDELITQVGGWIQLVGGLLVAFGLITRPAAFICSGMMAFAYFMFHVANAATPMAKLLPIASAGPQFSNKGELAVFYCFVFLYIFFRGGGLLSLDGMIWGGPAPSDAVGGPMRTGRDL